MIDILLGGDNAVVIALACRNLAPKQRMQGILWGTAGAIILRVVLIAFALTLLGIPFLKVVGGLMLVWIGVKLLIPEDDAHSNIKGGGSIMAAIKTIIIADFVMSLDNVIAIAGAAQSAHADHQLGLVIFGLVVSVPIIVWGSTLVFAFTTQVITGIFLWMSYNTVFSQGLLSTALSFVLSLSLYAGFAAVTRTAFNPLTFILYYFLYVPVLVAINLVMFLTQIRRTRIHLDWKT